VSQEARLTLLDESLLETQLRKLSTYNIWHVSRKLSICSIWHASNEYSKNKRSW